MSNLYNYYIATSCLVSDRASECLWRVKSAVGGGVGGWSVGYVAKEFF